MKKIIGFIKNYKKILLGGLIGLALVFTCTSVLHSIIVRNEIRDTNNTQLKKIYDKAADFAEIWEGFNSLFADPARRDIKVVYNLIVLEPDETDDTEFLRTCTENIIGIENLIILDNDRKIVNAYGELRGIDYSKPYYDGLFVAPEGVITTIYDENSDLNKTVSIKCGDRMILTQTNDENKNAPVVNQGIRWKIAKLAVGLDSASLFVAENRIDSSVIYSEIEGLKAEDLTIVKSTSGNYVTENHNYQVQFYDSEDGEIRLFALTPNTAIFERGKPILFIVMLVTIFALVILIAYIVCLRQDELDPAYEYKFLGKFFLSTQTKRYKSIAIIVGILITIVFMFGSAISEAEFDRDYLKKESEKCAEVFDAYTRICDQASEVNNNLMFGYGKVAGYFLEKYPEYLSKSGMTALSQAFNVKALSAIDINGNTVCTSSSLDNLNILDDPESPLYQLKLALIGKEGVVVNGDTEEFPGGVYIYGVPWRNMEGVADGLIAVIASHGYTNTIYKNINEEVYDVIDKSRSDEKTRVFFVNNYGVVIVDSEQIDNDIRALEGTMEDGYSGIITIDDADYLCAVKYIESTSDYMYVTMPMSMVKPTTIIYLIGLIFMYVLLALWTWYDGLGSKYHFEKRNNKVKDADDWKRTELYWEELSISKKMSKIFSVCIYVFTTLLIIVMILMELDVIENKTLSAILSGKWNNSFNGYSFIYNILIICIFFTATNGLEMLLMRLEQIFGDGAVTVFRLLGSLVKYMSALICAFVVVTNFGVDAATAIASIGIVGFAITFGAQELVKDMIAGMFILFEGNFKVGDMLDVNGDWYWIKSIGVRTTTLEAWGTVKVVNNSQMTGMVNIQNASAVVNCDVWVGTDYDVDEIEEIMRRELPKMKEKLPAEVSTPSWKGIQELSAAGTLIRMRTYCPPLSQGWVGRELRYTVKKILDDNGIKLSYEQYLIHYESIDPKEIRKEMCETMSKEADVTPCD